MESKAYILSVGNEVLSGKVINTNASYIALELEKLGIVVDKVITIADDKDMIYDSLNEFVSSDSKIIITTGGLGPTHDDFTKETIAEFLNIPLEYSKVAETDMINYFNEIKHDSNYKQLLQPKGSIVINNKIGTADGFILEVNDKCFISLVGPSYEMKPMFDDTVKKYLVKYASKLYVKEYTVMGISESEFEDELIGLVEYARGLGVSIAPYCDNAFIRYQITASYDKEKEFLLILDKFEKLANDYVVSENNEKVEEVIVSILKKKSLTISFSESITGGMLASFITSVAGASDILKESLVTYSKEAKNKYLGVSFDTIDKYDVVSKEVAYEMVKGLSKITNSDVNVSITGYAGPTGNDVGKVCYAIKYLDSIYTFEKHLNGNRNMIRKRACRSVLYDIYKLIK